MTERTIESIYRAFLPLVGGHPEAAASLTLAEVLLTFHADVEEATVPAPPVTSEVGLKVTVNGAEVPVEAEPEFEAKGAKLEALERKFRESFASPSK